MNMNSGKVVLHLSGTPTNEISNQQQLQDGMIELLQESNVAFAECRKGGVYLTIKLTDATSALVTLELKE